MLEIENITLNIGTKTCIAIEHLIIKPHQFYALVGKNGAGKSLLLKLLCNEISPNTGRILLHQRDIKTWDRKDLARHVGNLPSHCNLSMSMTAKELVALGSYPLTLSNQEKKQCINFYMKKMDCLHLAEQNFNCLSGGEQQRVNLARVLLQLSQAQEIPLLLLDEPTSAQDLKHQHTMLNFIKSSVKDENYTVIGVLHDLNHALNYSDQCLILENGKLVMNAQTKNALTAETITHFFDYHAQIIEHNGQQLIL